LTQGNWSSTDRQLAGNYQAGLVGDHYQLRSVVSIKFHEQSAHVSLRRGR
jgi:hypothetical protein